MNWGQLLFSFDGRVGRGVYWGYFLVMIVVFGALGAAMFMSMWSAASSADPQAMSGGTGIAGILCTVLGLASLWPSLAITAKRWHDVDKSAWWILIILVPAVGAIIALVFNGFMAGTPGPNRFGNPPA